MKKNFYFVQIFFTLVFFISSVFFFDLDNNIQLKNNFFAWDAFYYNEIVKNFDFNNLEISKTISPFHERILFPILYKTLHNLTGIELIYSASITNLVGVYISFTCFFIIGNYYKFSIKELLISSIFYLIFWSGPFRYSIWSPGLSFGFEVGLISLLILNLFFSIKAKHKNLILYMSLLILITLSTLQRGIIILVITLIPFILNFYSNYLRRKNRYNNFTFDKNTFRSKEILIFLVSLISIFFVKFVTNGYGSFSIVKSIIKFSYFNLNIINFISTFFIYLGPFFVIILSYIYLKKNRLKFLKKNLQNIEFLFWTTVIIISILFSKIGGDPDRPLMWFWNAYLILSIFCFKKIKIKNLKILIFLFVISLLWSRPYLPAQPPLAFSNMFIQNVFVSTNYDDKLYRGIKFFKKFRNELEKIEIKFGEPYNNDYHKNLKQKIYINKDKYELNCIDPLDKSNLNFTVECAINPYIFSYRHRINNIPFPLGYLHNQRDALVDHPLLGKSWVLYCLAVQWLMVTIIFIFLIKKMYSSTLKI